MDATDVRGALRQRRKLPAVTGPWRPVNARNDAGGTALMYAVDDVAKTKLLLERGADPNLRSGEGRTALMIAVANSGSFPVVKLLLEKGADAKLSLPDGRGALALAATSLDPQVLQLLLDRGATRRFRFRLRWRRMPGML